MQNVLRILFWTYQRGTWQYDVLCAFILVFIFLTPAAVFDRSVNSKEQDSFFEMDNEEPNGSMSGIRAGVEKLSS